MTGLIAQVASYHGTTLEITEPDPLFHVCLKKQSACIGAWFYKPVAMEVIETHKSMIEWVSEYFWQYIDLLCLTGVSNSFTVSAWSEEALMPVREDSGCLLEGKKVLLMDVDKATWRRFQ